MGTTSIPSSHSERRWTLDSKRRYCSITKAMSLRAAGENFFFVRDGVLYTPELTSCLEGITRDSILRIAADQGLTVKEKRITRDEVYVADEAFFTGTAAEVVPIRELDNRMIGSGTRGPITEKLQAIYFEAVRGAQPDYAEWLAPVAD